MKQIHTLMFMFFIYSYVTVSVKLQSPLLKADEVEDHLYPPWICYIEDEINPNEKQKSSFENRKFIDCMVPPQL